jgi:hypothetical protein
MFPEPVEYNDANLKSAVEQVSSFQADMGGTEIHSPLQYIFDQPSQYPRAVFLLTDGEVDSPSIVVDLIKENRGNSRVHSFGIGNGVDRNLIIQSAKAGNGVSEFVASGENMQVKVIDVLKSAMMPALCNWEITCSGPAANIVPKCESLPAVYFNESFYVFAKFDADPTGSTLNLRCLNTKTEENMDFVIPIEASTRYS